MRLAVVEPPGAELGMRLKAALLPGIELVAAGPLATIARSDEFPTEVVVVVDDGDFEGVLTRIGVCRCLGARVIVQQTEIDSALGRRFEEAGAIRVLAEQRELIELLIATAENHAIARPRAASTRRLSTGRLSPGESGALALYAAGASRVEVALQLAVSVETVKTLLSRGRRKSSQLDSAEG